MFEFFNLFGGNLSSITPGLLLAFGFVTGLQHAVEADHVAAVATLVSKNRKLSKASLLGALWGFGHTITLFIAGLVVLMLAISIPANLSLFLEFGVGIMLVVLGLSVIINLKMGRFIDWFGVFGHMHPHAHGNKIHVHRHSHDSEHDHSHKSIIVGMIHGLAGSGALMLVVLSTVDSIVNGLAYITLFGIGSIVGMLAVSTIIGLPFVLTAKKFSKLNKTIRVAAAIASMGLGLSIMYEIGFVEQLFIT
ncbi:MAG: sulfite exporter TauE/SafE family protein [Nitrososphaerales archaeon]